jgi:hypothetical protein
VLLLLPPPPPPPPLLLLLLLLQVVFNKDSSRVGPKEWVQIAKLLDKNRCVQQTTPCKLAQHEPP